MKPKPAEVKREVAFNKTFAKAKSPNATRGLSPNTSQLTAANTSKDGASQGDSTTKKHIYTAKSPSHETKVNPGEKSGGKSRNPGQALVSPFAAITTEVSQNSTLKKSFLHKAAVNPSSTTFSQSSKRVPLKNIPDPANTATLKAPSFI